MRMGYPCDLADPKTFNEKIQWLKLNERTELHTQCADKLAVRQFVKERLGDQYLIPLLKVFDNSEQVSVDEIGRSSFVIKTNHDSGTVFIVKESKEVDFPLIKSKLKQKLSTNYYPKNREWQYKNIKPKVIVEQLLLTERGDIPNDYKVHCFNGKPKFIQVDTARFSNHQRAIFDVDWNLVDVEYVYEMAKGVCKPASLTEMLRCAERLSEGFSFARVDFFDCDGKLFFGEISFHPESGFGKFKPSSFDRAWGDLIELEQ